MEYGYVYEVRIWKKVVMEYLKTPSQHMSDEVEENV
jgi:hypothetical protein